MSNRVQILEKESGLGQKIIDDGVSTVAALKACAAEYADDSSLTREGNLWPESLVTIFRYGLSVRVVAYTDDDDLESREAWNIAEHDEENNSVRWSSLHQKVTAVRKLYKRLSDWRKVKASLVERYGPGKGPTIGRWVRAGKGMDDPVFEELQLYARRARRARGDPHFMSRLTWQADCRPFASSGGMCWLVFLQRRPPPCSSVSVLRVGG